MMKVRYIDDYECASLEHGAVYDVVDVVEPFEGIPCYGIVDELRDLSYYPWNMFEVVSGLAEAEGFCIPT